MARDEPSRHHSTLPAALETPLVSLVGTVNEMMVDKLCTALAGDSGENDVAIEVTTSGGDAEIGRRLALDVERAAARRKGRLLFFGKTEVYSAGVTMMSAFAPRNRFLTHDAVLLIHCRQLQRTLELSGPLRSNLPVLDALRTEIEVGLELERLGFQNLVEGTAVTLEEVYERAPSGWYLRAEEAAARGLVADVV